PPAPLVEAPEAEPAVIEIVGEATPPVDIDTSVADRARSYREFLARETPAGPPAGAPPPAPVRGGARPWPPPPPAFLEDKNIRWGEIVGGLLIVGCSLALVLSFWSSIAERPVLKFAVFTGVTGVLFGIGLHAERRWKLPSTAQGLLVIATLLVPLNF